MSENYIAICRDNYTTEEEFKLAIANQLLILADNEYEVCFRYEDFGIFIIEYLPDYRKGSNGEWEDRYMRVTADEAENIINIREYTEASDVDPEDEKPDENIIC